MSKPNISEIVNGRMNLKSKIAHALEDSYGSNEVQATWVGEELYITVHDADMVFRIEPEFYTTLD